MHPPLSSPDKQSSCAEVIQALADCHASSFLAKYTGGCNAAKHDLTMCLRGERIERTTKNREQAKLRTIKKHEVWEELEKE